MKSILFLTGIMIMSLGCERKKASADEKTTFFPVLSFIKSQVADVDTSVYPLLKIVTVDSVADSSYIKREEFKTYASDFLSIPDISSEELRDHYTESKMYDETLGRVILDYIPKKKDDEIRREEVMIVPDAQQGDKVKAIIIDRLINTADNTVQKRLFWQVDKRFQIVTIVQKRAQLDKIQTTEVVWNDFASN